MSNPVPVVDRYAFIRKFADTGVTLVRVPGVKARYEARTCDDYLHFCARLMEMGDWAGVKVARRRA